MAQADPSIKFVAIELAGGPQGYVPVFAANVTARVDVAAKHFYSTCNHRDQDQTLFATVPGFASDIQAMYQELAANPALANVPIWVTENNVNADYDKGGGVSQCNAPQLFVLDTRGTSPFFAAWRTLVFSRLGKAGTQALYHWAFGTDQQYGEVDDSGNPYLSYWVDYYLSHWLPSPPGQDILQSTVAGCCATDYTHGWEGAGGLQFDTETLAARNVDGSVVVLMSNFALNASSDNNGPGTARTFALDLSALGTFQSATLVKLDASTPRSGPPPATMTPAAQMQVTLSGYGAALLRLSNAAPTLPSAGVVNAASGVGGAVAPGEIVSLYGTAIGPQAGANLTLTNPSLVTNTLEGVHVLFDGTPAALTYASAGQVNAVVPYGVAGKSSTQLQVEYLGALTAPVTLPVAATAPGVFTINGSGKGQGAILNAKDGSVNSVSHPAAVGDYISIFATGGGATTPASVDGILTSLPLPYANAPVSVTIGGITRTAIYAGGAPGLIAGALQINVQVPEGVTAGPSVPLEVTVGNATAQAGVTLAVQ